MKLKEVRVERFFKRFTDLTVQGIPPTARLIILAGPNGCGKSSFFEALHTWCGRNSGRTIHWSAEYNFKDVQSGYVPIREGASYVSFHDYDIDKVTRQNNRKVFRIRTAYRNDPEFQINQITRVGSLLNERQGQPIRMIDNDAAVARHYQRLVGQALYEALVEGAKTTTLGDFREEILGDIRKALLRLFPDLELNSLGNPLIDGTFRFTKGTSQGFGYINLSGGEKAAFDLILDLVIARREYDNTVFCIDEPESHMNARLQAELLSVLYDLVPENCQLMLATHSIGMMRRAQDIEAENPGSVVFLDFDLDFDEPQVIEPTVPDRAFWNRVYAVALDDLAELVAPERVVICEGTPKGTESVRNHSHDARCYDRIFETEFPETKFVSIGNDKAVIGDKRGLAKILGLLIEKLEVVRLVDRDDRHPEEDDDLNKGVRVLSRRNLECYLFDDEVLQALAKSVNKEDKAEDILAAKKSIMEEKPPSDNLKLASGKLYNECKRILSLTQCGNDAKAFMRYTLAPLVTPEMKVYKELRRDIFGI